MKKLGFKFWGLTPQNEPLHAGNEPSMAMSADEQLDFINNHLGPALEQSTHPIKILAYDHNCDHPEYPQAQTATLMVILAGNMEHVVIGATRNWARTVLEWNLASTPPSLARGRLDCQGAVSINEETHSITRHVSYYIIGQLSRALPAGSTRIASSDNNNGIFNVAFSTPEGQHVLFVYNSTDTQQKISVHSQQVASAHLPITIAPRSALTLSWQSFTLD